MYERPETKECMQCGKQYTRRWSGNDEAENNSQARKRKIQREHGRKERGNIKQRNKAERQKMGFILIN